MYENKIICYSECSLSSVKTVSTERVSETCGPSQIRTDLTDLMDPLESVTYGPRICKLWIYFCLDPVGPSEGDGSPGSVAYRFFGCIRKLQIPCVQSLQILMDPLGTSARSVKWNSPDRVTLLLIEDEGHQ